MSHRDEPAFPYSVEITASRSYVMNPGLTKRELLAAMAMQGLLSAGHGAWPFGPSTPLAEAAVQAADALLAELEKGAGG